METDPHNIEDLVNEQYSSIALNIKSGQTCCTSTCCSSDLSESKEPQELQEQCCDTGCCEDLQDTTDDPLHVSSDSLGCDLRLEEVANPKSGETVIDLGSGPGHDSRSIADIVGKHGEVIGIDFGEEMIELAKSNSKQYSNLEFKKAKVTETGLSDGIADLVISNCVINLVPDKKAVFEEAFRILKSGGRFVFSDMITTSDFDNLQQEDYCACIGGATSIQEYETYMEKVGFVDISTILEYEGKYKGSNQIFDYQSVLFVGYKK